MRTRGVVVVQEPIEALERVHVEKEANLEFESECPGAPHGAGHL
jgi:hypothetical protein